MATVTVTATHSNLVPMVQHAHEQRHRDSNCKIRAEHLKMRDVVQGCYDFPATCLLDVLTQVGRCLGLRQVRDLFDRQSIPPFYCLI